MSRRLVLFGLLAASQLSAGCWCVRERIAWRWQNHIGIGGGPGCAPACTATPAFRIPSPVVGSPVGYGGPIGGPIGAPGCSTCTSGDAGPVGYGGPIGYGGPGGYAVPVVSHGPLGAPPIIGSPMPLGAPRVETPTTNGAPKN